MDLDFLTFEISVYILVFSRIAGMIFFNPLLSRKNLPSQVKVALVLGITLLTTPLIDLSVMPVFTDLSFMVAMAKELLIGFSCGYIFTMFYYMLFAAGDIIDMGFGLSMAKAFDPGSNVQMSMTGNIFQMIFVLYIFSTNSHLLLIRLITSSYDFIGIGLATFDINVPAFVAELFTSVFFLAMQLALPFIAATFTLEISMGILMKLIPQINVFVINFQFKVLFGLILLFFFAEPISEFLLKYIDKMFLSMQKLFEIM